MSGGALDYICYRVGTAAEDIAARADTPLHRAFAEHLRQVATALHDLEWVWSGDSSPGDEIEAIKAIVSPVAVVQEATKAAVKVRDELNAALLALADPATPKEGVSAS